MKKIIVLLFAVLGIIGCKSEPKSFMINGTVTDVPDSTLIMLYTENKILDSVRVSNGSFNFSGTIDRPTPTNIVIAYSRDAKRFWLDNSDITFEGSNKKFRNAKITGSTYEDEDDRFQLRMKKFEEMELDLQTYAEENYEELTEEIADSLRSVMANIERLNYLDVLAYSTENPNSLIGTYYLYFYKTSLNKNEVEEGYYKLSEEMKNSYYGKRISQFLDNNEMILGVKYADITLENTEGVSTSLSDNLGKVTLIEFWADWCLPCREANPKWVKVYEKFQSKGFEVYGVSFDRRKEDWFRALQEDKLPWVNVIDTTAMKGDVGTQYGINMLPWKLLLDENGIIIAKNISPEEIGSKLRTLLP